MLSEGHSLPEPKIIRTDLDPLRLGLIDELHSLTALRTMRSGDYLMLQQHHGDELAGLDHRRMQSYCSRMEIEVEVRRREELSIEMETKHFLAGIRSQQRNRSILANEKR